MKRYNPYITEIKSIGKEWKVTISIGGQTYWANLESGHLINQYNDESLPLQKCMEAEMELIKEVLTANDVDFAYAEIIDTGDQVQVQVLAELDPIDEEEAAYEREIDRKIDIYQELGEMFNPENQ